MFDEGIRTITVTLLDNETKIKIDGVPSDVTASSLLSKLLTLDSLKDIKEDIEIMCDNTIIPRSGYIESDDVKLVAQPKKKRAFSSFFLLLLFIFSHVTPFILYIMEYRLWYILTIYVISLFVLGIFCLILKPSPRAFSDLWNSGSSNIVIDIFVLFIKTLNPYFRLEQVLMENN